MRWREEKSAISCNLKTMTKPEPKHKHRCPKVLILWGQKLHVVTAASQLLLLTCLYVYEPSHAFNCALQPSKYVFLLAPTLARSSQPLRFILCFPLEVAQLRAPSATPRTWENPAQASKKTQGTRQLPDLPRFSGSLLSWTCSQETNWNTWKKTY